MVVKIERLELKRRFVALFKNEITFSCNEGINPFVCKFHSKTYYIYIKNLSPAYFNNQDIWRIQLPIRDVFNDIKVSESYFLLLGYDSENDVYTTWNPYWAKQRLNIAESVSFYSRLSLQEQSSKKQIVIEKELNNDGKVIIFPRRLLIFVLDSINNYFPEDTKYVAIGSKRRQEANKAFKEFTLQSNIYDFEEYIKSCSSNINKEVGALLELMDYVRTNKHLFLEYDNLSNYDSAIDVLCDSDNNITEGSKDFSKDLLKEYLSFLQHSIATGDNTTTVKEVSIDDPIEDFDSYINYIKDKNEYVRMLYLKIKKPQKFWFRWLEFLDSGLLDQNIQYFRKYHSEDTYFKFINSLNEIKNISKYDSYVYLLSGGILATSNYIEFLNHSRGIHKELINKDGKLQAITHPQLIELLKPVVCQKYRNLVQAYNIVSEFYKGQFNNMDLKDWRELFDKLAEGTVEITIKNIRKTKKIIRVEFPDGKVVQERLAYNTLVEVIKTVGVVRIRDLNIISNGDNLITNKINPLYERAYKQVGGGYFVNTVSNTNKKIQQIETISEALNLNLQVSKVDPNTSINSLTFEQNLEDYSINKKVNKEPYDYDEKSDFVSNAAEDISDVLTNNAQ